MNSKRHVVSRFGLLLLLTIAVDVSVAAPKRALLLHSFGREFEPYPTFSEGFRAELDREASEPLGYFDVALESAKLDDQGREALFAVSLRNWQLYGGRIALLISALVAQGVIIFFLLASRTARQRAEKSLRESSRRLQSILDTAVEGIITMNESGVIESANAASSNLFGYSSSEMLGENISMLISPSSRQTCDILPRLRPAPAGGLAFQPELTGRRKNGTTFPLELDVSESVLGDRCVLTGFVRDITDRELAAQASREFGRRVIRAQEEERARLARELHDDITQRLARLAIDAGRAGTGQPQRGVTEAFHAVRDGIIRLSEDVHSLAYKLHPALLEDLGLVDALRAECERFSREESIPVQIALAEIPIAIPQELGLCLFRITQEALRNVARHSRASKANVSLRLLDDGLQLAVTDNGTGFDCKAPSHQTGLGLVGMRERVQLLGGELDIDTAPGQGTNIVAWLPMKENSA